MGWLLLFKNQANGLPRALGLQTRRGKWTIPFYLESVNNFGNRRDLFEPVGVPSTDCIVEKKHNAFEACHLAAWTLGSAAAKSHTSEHEFLTNEFADLYAASVKWLGAALLTFGNRQRALGKLFH